MQNTLSIGRFLILWFAVAVPAQTPRLVKDINTEVVASPSNPRPGASAKTWETGQFVRVLKTTYFVATHPTYGVELFETDGTAAGTRLVMDIRPGPGGSHPEGLMTDSWRLFFTADDGRCGRELWIAEPLFGKVRRVADINPAGGQGSNPAHMTHLDGKILFQASDVENRNSELWVTDGSQAGTRKLKEIAATTSVASAPRNFSVHGRLAYFQAFDGRALTLWRSDGTEAGTQRIGPMQVDPDRGGMVEFRGSLYFSGFQTATGLELWRLDPNSDEATLVHDVLPGSRSSGVGNLTVFDDALYFSAEGAVRGTEIGEELWRTDGTSLRAFDLFTGYAGSQPELLQVFGSGSDQALFLVASGTLPGTTTPTGPELWRIDSVGVEVFDLIPGTRGSGPRNLVLGPRERLYFTASNAEQARELWRSDGSAAGTLPFRSLNRYQRLLGSEPAFLTPIPALGLLFSCDDGPHGRELWRSDGTDGGTVLVADIHPRPSSTRGSDPVLRGVFGDSVCFSASASSEIGRSGSVRGLWRTDGTEAGTRRIPALDAAGVAGVMEMVECGDRLFLAGTGMDPQGNQVGFELWVVDQRDGRVRLLDLRRGEAGSLPLRLTVVDGVVYFSADGDLGNPGGASGHELWRSDGTVAGTWMVADIEPGRPSSDPDQMVGFRGRLYFAARDAAHGLELWSTDGTAAGTTRVTDLNPGRSDSHPHGMAEVRGRLLFVATSSGYGTELYALDGIFGKIERIDLRAGAGSGFPKWHKDPRRVFTVVGSYAYFAADGDLHRTTGLVGLELWRSDGTVAGTTLVADVWHGEAGSDPGGIAPLGNTGQLVFLAHTGFGLHGGYAALWVTDGTAAGTVEIHKMRPEWRGAEDSQVGSLGAGRAFVHCPLYSLGRMELGSELILTDGSRQGTQVLYTDFYPVGGTSQPCGVFPAATGQLFVTRVVQSVGAEVFVIDGLALAAVRGTGCAPSGPPPTLLGDDPKLGGVFHPEVRGPGNALGVLVVGMWQPAALAIGSGCRLHVDLVGPQVYLPFAVRATGWWRGALSTAGAIPGRRYAVQACLMDPNLRAAVWTNGLVLTPENR